MRNALAHAGKSGRRVVSAFMATAFAQDSPDAAKAQWRKVADQLRPKPPKLALFMDEAEADVLAYMSFPKEHWPKIHSANGLGRSTARSSEAPKSSASFPTMRPSSGSWARSCWNRTTNGPCSDRATWPWKPSPP
jgi:transposase-like protein